MNGSLRAELLGTWRLREFTETVVATGEITRPFGDDVNGLLIYTADGNMSAQLMRVDRTRFESTDWLGARDADYASAAKNHIAYAGTFEVDEVARTVIHQLEIALIPNWVRARFRRFVTLMDGTLVLKTPEQARPGGGYGVQALTWTRRRPSARAA